MAKIWIEPTGMKTTLLRLDELERILQNLSQDVVRVRTKMSTLKMSGNAQLLSKLRNATEQLEREATKTRAMYDGLEQIISLYTRIEQKNMNNLGDKKNSIQEGAQSEGDWMSKIQIIDPNSSLFKIVGPDGQLKFDFDWKDIAQSFGDAGDLLGALSSIVMAKSWTDWGKAGTSLLKTVSAIAKNYNHYNKIGRVIGTANADAYFWKNFFGLRKVGHVSTASSASMKFYNNLHMKTSPYKLSSVFDSFKGKNGVVSSVTAWAGLALSGVTNAFSNIEEQKKSNGTMSTGRVIAETISETAIDTVVTYAGTAVVGAAIATVTGAVAAPAVVAIATGAALAGVNAGVKALTGKSATEFVSDAILDFGTAVGSVAVKGANAVGNAVAQGANAVAGWFGKLKFA